MQLSLSKWIFTSMVNHPVNAEEYFIKKMNSKLKELGREKESLRRKTERLYKRTQTVKKTTTKFSPKRIVHLTKQEICPSRVKGIRKQVLYGKVLTQDYV